MKKIKYLVFCFNNKGDDLVLRKNLSLHTDCVDGFSKFLKKEVKQRKQYLITEMI